MVGLKHSSLFSIYKSFLFLLEITKEKKSMFRSILLAVCAFCFISLCILQTCDCNSLSEHGKILWNKNRHTIKNLFIYRIVFWGSSKDQLQIENSEKLSKFFMKLENEFHAKMALRHAQKMLRGKIEKLARYWLLRSGRWVTSVKF